ncbi:MAG: biopolymer transporter ExbD [Kofleriaceae bacterium]|nr:biopolymer transporter ExbD [Kofleriaceae bacterium]MCB9574549.1 biopolymer transporter ExbD [Kofleriaceae bacterium]
MNVTPLVDVVLVLLIIFMVIIPQMQAGAPVNVPGIANPDQAPDASHPPITLSVTKGGRLFLEKAEVAREDLLATLREAHARAAASKLILKGDRDAPYGLMRSLFKECQEVGFPGVSLQVGDLRKGEGA